MAPLLQLQPINPAPTLNHLTQLPTLNFVDEGNLSASTKATILEHWHWFIQNGFKRQCFSYELYAFLTMACGFYPQANQDTFWLYYFHSDLNRLRAFLNQFGGNRVSAEIGNYVWLEAAASDLKQAMCEDLARVFPHLIQLLHLLEQAHNGLINLWYQPMRVGAPAPLIPLYTVDDNTHNLMSYVTVQVLTYAQALSGLQVVMPNVTAPAPVVIEGHATTHAAGA